MRRSCLAPALGSLGDLDAFDFRDEASYGLEQPPLRCVLQTFGNKLDRHPGIIRFGEDYAEVCLVARQSIERMRNDNIDFASSDRFPEFAQLGTIEELAPGEDFPVHTAHRPPLRSGKGPAGGFLRL
jgi:hypothetical protein